MPCCSCTQFDQAESVVIRSASTYSILLLTFVGLRSQALRMTKSSPIKPALIYHLTQLHLDGGVMKRKAAVHARATLSGPGFPAGLADLLRGSGPKGSAGRTRR